MSDAREGLCEAAAMDAAAMLGRDNPLPVPPCDAVATVERSGYRLCLGCADSLDVLLSVTESLLRRLRREAHDPEAGPWLDADRPDDPRPT